MLHRHASTVSDDAMQAIIASTGRRCTLRVTRATLRMWVTWFGLSWSWGCSGGSARSPGGGCCDAEVMAYWPPTLMATSAFRLSRDDALYGIHDGFSRPFSRLLRHCIHCGLNGVSTPPPRYPFPAQYGDHHREARRRARSGQRLVHHYHQLTEVTYLCDDDRVFPLRMCRARKTGLP